MKTNKLAIMGLYFHISLNYMFHSNQPDPLGEAGVNSFSIPVGDVEELVKEIDSILTLRVGQNRVRLCEAALKRFQFLVRDDYSRT